jgi:hypothetical protein
MCLNRAHTWPAENQNQTSEKAAATLSRLNGDYRFELENVPVFLNAAECLTIAHNKCCDEGCYPGTAFVRDLIGAKKSAFEALGNLKSVRNPLWCDLENFGQAFAGECSFEQNNKGQTIEEKTDREYVCTAPICNP